MNFERPPKPRTEAAPDRIKCLTELPLFEAGLTAALRRAYAAPVMGHGDYFEDLLAKLH